MISSKYLQVITAFSRDDPTRTIYVQHRIDEYGAEIWNLINDRNATIFVAGNAHQMPNDIVDTLKSIVSTYGHIENANEYVEHMQKIGRLQFETWS